MTFISSKWVCKFLCCRVLQRDVSRQSRKTVGTVASSCTLHRVHQGYLLSAFIDLLPCWAEQNRTLRRAWTDAEAVYSYRGLEERLCQIVDSQVQNSCITWKWCVGWTLGLSLFGRIVRSYNCTIGDWIIDWCISRMADWFPDWWIDKMAGLQPVFKVFCLH